MDQYPSWGAATSQRWKRGFAPLQEGSRVLYSMRIQRRLTTGSARRRRASGRFILSDVSIPHTVMFCGFYGLTICCASRDSKILRRVRFELSDVFEWYTGCVVWARGYCTSGRVFRGNLLNEFEKRREVYCTILAVFTVFYLWFYPRWSGTQWWMYCSGQLWEFEAQ